MIRKEIMNIIRGLLKGIFREKKLDAPLHPSEIAVLYPARTGSLSAEIDKLIADLKTITNVLWVTDPKNKNKENIGSPDLKVSTIHSAKGLQFKAVLIFGTEILPINPVSEDAMIEAKKLLYVAMTRAEDILVIAYSASSSLTERLKKLAQSGLCDICN
jgi:ATP-dependent exoDNAse (exonuclease V) beta subunit